MITRPGTYDKSMVADGQKSYRRLGIQSGDRVLDVGAHIGGFSRYAALLGAKVVAYEPVSENVELLRRNCAGLDVEVRPRAVLWAEGSATIHLTTGPHTGHHSFVIESSHRVDRVVPADAFLDVLREVQPARVKIDVEGAEHAYDFADLPDTVAAIAIEIELSRPEWRTGAARIAGQLDRQGFIAIKMPRGRSYSTGIWVR